MEIRDGKQDDGQREFKRIDIQVVNVIEEVCCLELHLYPKREEKGVEHHLGKRDKGILISASNRL